MATRESRIDREQPPNRKPSITEIREKVVNAAADDIEDIFDILEGLTIANSGGKLPEYIGPVGIRSAYADTFGVGNVTKYLKGVAVETIVSTTNIIVPVFSSICGLGNNENSMLTGTFTGRFFISYKGQHAWVSIDGTPGGVGTGQMGGSIMPDLDYELPFTVIAGDTIEITYDLAFFPDGNNRYPIYQDNFNLAYPGVGELCISSTTPMAAIELGVRPTTTGGGIVQTAFNYRPHFILGKTTEETAMITGDSINRGPVTFNRNVFNDRLGVTGILAAFLAKAKIGFINCSFSGDDYLNASQAGRYAKRGACAQWVTTWIPMLGTNDLGNATNLTVTQFINYMAAVKSQLVVGSRLRTIPATILARALNSPLSTAAAFIAYFTNQQPQTNNGARVGINRAIRNGVVPSDSFIEVAAYMETSKDSGIQPFPPEARIVADAVTTSGSNLVDSATAKFNESSTGGRISVEGAGASSGPLSGFMTYVSPTRVAVVNSIGAASNASATLENAVAYVNYQDWTDDALHVSPRGRDTGANRMISAGEHLKII